MKNYFFLPVALLIANSFIAGCSKGNSGSDNGTPPPKSDTVVSIKQVDNAVTAFMTNYNVPGASVAITKNGKLVYVKSYGKAYQEAGTDVSSASLFRIASVSKPITSVTILRLVEQGRLSLSDYVFGPGAILGTEYGTYPYGPNINKITIRNLLHHTGGGWTNDGDDPMFLNPGMDQHALISWTLDNQPLVHVPGTFYAYSNFGYCILGRVIEKITGQPYAQYVKDTILKQMGITDMQIGGNTFGDRRTNEVKYYGQGGEDAYSFNLTRMDSHGGWLATATDLARFLVKVDGFATVPDILSPASITTMTTTSTASPDYGCGWDINSSNNWWHSGSLPGTGTEIVRTAGGFCWVVLFNTRSLKDGFDDDMDQIIWKAVDDPATVWPDVNLF